MNSAFSAQNPNLGHSFADTSLSKDIKLIYRGQSFDYVPRTARMIPVEHTRKVKLVYRGQAYQGTVPMIPAYLEPHPQAINWRFQNA